MNLKEFHKDWFSKNGRHSTNQFFNRVQKSDEYSNELNNYILDNGIDVYLPYKEKMYLFLNDKLPGRCVVEGCNKPTGFLDWFTGYSDTCSKSCRAKILWDTNRKEERSTRPPKEKCTKTQSEINKENYANLSPEKKIARTEKRKATNLKKYGVTNPMLTKESQEKRKKRMIEKYGVESPWAVPKFRKKIAETNLERYGVENPMHNIKIQERNYQANPRYKKESGIKTQGHGDIALRDLLLRYSIDDIVSESECPHFMYSYPETPKIYRPDFYIAKDNLIIEVKSTYTLMVDPYKNWAKFLSVINSKYDFLLYLIQKEGEILVFDKTSNIFADKIKELFPGVIIFHNAYMTLLPTENKLFYFRNPSINDYAKYETRLQKYLRINGSIDLVVWENFNVLDSIFDSEIDKLPISKF